MNTLTEENSRQTTLEEFGLFLYLKFGDEE